MKQKGIHLFAPAVLAAGLLAVTHSPAPVSAYLSPTAVAASPDGKTLYIACATANEVLLFDVPGRKVRHRVPVPDPPTGLALSADGARLYVTCAAPSSRICVLDARRAKIVDTLPAGHTATGPVLSPDGQTLFICNRFDNNVSVIDLRAKKELRRIRVEREPVAAAITKNGEFVLVANLLHNGRTDVDYVAAAVSVIDVAAGRVYKELRLPNGSGVLRDIRTSPDGRYASVTHLLARTYAPTSQIERGWMNSNAATIIDLAKMEIVNTVTLDDASTGAANPWGLAWTADGETLVVSHAGTHQVSVIDFPALLAKLARLPATTDEKEMVFVAASRTQADVADDLSFLTGVRKLIDLPDNDRGPRATAVIGRKAYVANYFSDTLSEVDLDASAQAVESIPLGPKQPLSTVRQGERYFNDADLCFQRWQSCASCHPGNARTDALNWDLLNDGIANPKNNRSLLLCDRTPPAMSLGVREDAKVAVQAGIERILLTVQPKQVEAAILAYLQSLKPVPSPYLVDGTLSKAAARGRALFNNSAVGCASCHPAGLFTDLKPYDVGTCGRFDKGDEKFDTPTLIEVWRTAPYLHDGSAATMRDVLTVKNTHDKHGRTSHLTPEQIHDLAEYVLSL